jgi:hypothetical protein
MKRGNSPTRTGQTGGGKTRNHFFVFCSRKAPATENGVLAIRTATNEQVDESNVQSSKSKATNARISDRVWGLEEIVNLI